MNSVKTASRTLSPWLAIWIYPRSTIRRLVAASTDRWVYILAAASGVHWVWTLALAWIRQTGVGQASVLLVLLLGGPILGISLMYLLGFVLRIVGRWFGGSARSRDIRMAYAWSSVPAIASFAIALLADLVIGPVPQQASSVSLGPDALRLAQTLESSSRLAIGLWGAGIWWICLAEVHDFSVWRAVLTIGIGGALIGLVAGFGVLFLVSCGLAAWFVTMVLLSNAG